MRLRAPTRRSAPGICTEIDGCVQRETVAVSAQAHDAAGRDIRQITVVTERLSREDIADMDFDERLGAAEQRITQRDARVPQSRRVDNQYVASVRPRRLHPLYQFVLGIASKTRQLAMPRCGARLQILFYLVQRARPV
jgi:hypothetical protein